MLLVKTGWFVKRGSTINPFLTLTQYCCVKLYAIFLESELFIDGQTEVTHNQMFAAAKWGGQSFMLVDTVGYMPNAKDALSAAVSSQAATDQIDYKWPNSLLSLSNVR